MSSLFQVRQGQERERKISSWPGGTPEKSVFVNYIVWGRFLRIGIHTVRKLSPCAVEQVSQSGYIEYDDSAVEGQRNEIQEKLGPEFKEYGRINPVHYASRGNTNPSRSVSNLGRSRRRQSTVGNCNHRSSLWLLAEAMTSVLSPSTRAIHKASNSPPRRESPLLFLKPHPLLFQTPLPHPLHAIVRNCSQTFEVRCGSNCADSAF